MDIFCSSMVSNMGDEKRHGVSLSNDGNSEAAQAAQICLKARHKSMELWEAQAPTSSMAELYSLFWNIQWSTLILARYSASIGRQDCWPVAAITLNSQKPKLSQNQTVVMSIQKRNINIEQICRYINKLVSKIHKQQWKLSMFPSVVMSLLPKK